MNTQSDKPVVIPLPQDEELSAEIQERLSQLPPLNVFRMMAKTPANFNSLLEFASTILFSLELDARKREIAVLRVAYTTGSNYEWVQHIQVAKQVGVTDQEIEIIGAEDPVSGLDDEGNLLCRVADEISRDVRLSDQALASIMKLYGERQAAELILCCSYFNMLSRILESTRVPLEEQPVL